MVKLVEYLVDFIGFCSTLASPVIHQVVPGDKTKAWSEHQSPTKAWDSHISNKQSAQDCSIQNDIIYVYSQQKG